MNKFLLAAVTLLLSVNGVAETFSGGRTAWRLPEGTWVDATIEVEADAVRVYSRETNRLVATFDMDNIRPIENTNGDLVGNDVESRRTGARSAIGGLIMGGGIFMGIQAAEQAREKNDAECAVDYSSDSCLDGGEVPYEALAGTIAAIVVGAAIAFSKSNTPYFQLSNGLQRLEVRVNKGLENEFERSVLNAVQ